MPVLLVREDTDDRVEICSGTRAATESDFRPGSLVPKGDWRLITRSEVSAVSDRYSSGRPLLGNIALIRVLDDVFQSEQHNRGPMANRRAELRILDDVCKRLAGGALLENKGCWLSTGGGGSLSTTVDRRDGLRIGLHVDRWERRSLDTLSDARNRVCLNLGPNRRYFVFLPNDLREIADIYDLGFEDTFTTSHAKVFLRDHPDIPVFRLRLEPGEAYIAPTESLIHDGQAFSTAGEWVSTIFGRFANSEEVMCLSVV